MAKQARKRLIQALLDLALDPKVCRRSRFRAAEMVANMIGAPKKLLPKKKAKKKLDVLGLRPI